jgi:hypothetical protein
LTSSYASSANASLTTGATYPITASWATTASYALMASSSLSASYALTSSYALKASSSLSASYTLSSSWVSASNVQGTVHSASYALTASYAPSSPGIGNVIYRNIDNYTYSRSAAEYIAQINYLAKTGSLTTLPVDGMYRLDVAAWGSQSNTAGKGGSIYFSAKFTNPWGTTYVVKDNEYTLYDINGRPINGLMWGGPIGDDANALLGGYGGEFHYYFSYLFAGKAGSSPEYYWSDEYISLGDGTNYTASFHTAVAIEQLAP